MQEEKKSVQARISGLRDLQKQMRDETRQLKETVQGSYFKVEDIDKEINRLEARIAHEGLDLSEEKRVMDQIRSLKRSRDNVAQFQKKVRPRRPGPPICPPRRRHVSLHPREARRGLSARSRPALAGVGDGDADLRHGRARGQAQVVQREA